MTANRSITSLPSHQRPRERLAELGAANLKTEELLALILNTGFKKTSSLEIAKNLLKKLPDLLTSSPPPTALQLQLLPGLGQVQAMRIVALIELIQRASFTRLSRSTIDSHQPNIATVTDVIHQVKKLRNSKREHLLALYLNARTQLLNKEVVAIGSLNVTNIHPRDVLAPALKLPAVGIVIVHNHPSGNPQPSQEDLHVTKQLQDGCELVGLQLVDHVIITTDQHYSFRETGLL